MLSFRIFTISLINMDLISALKKILFLSIQTFLFILSAVIFYLVTFLFSLSMMSLDVAGFQREKHVIVRRTWSGFELCVLVLAISCHVLSDVFMDDDSWERSLLPPCRSEGPQCAMAIVSVLGDKHSTV